MDDGKLVAMANQIAGFFRVYPPDDAARGIADHLQAFWTPKMLSAIRARVSADQHGVDPAVLLALHAPPDSVRSPIAKTVAGPGEQGHLAADAG